MADAADNASEAAADTPGDVARDGAQTSIESVGDVAPRRKRGRPKGSKTKPKEPGETGAGGDPTDQEKKELRKLKKRLTAVLTGPSMGLEEWPASHVEAAAPDLASAIVTVCEQDPKLRKRLLRFFEGGTTANLIAAAVIYVGPVAIYYGAPAPPIVRRMVDIPDRQLWLAEQRQGGSGPPMPPPLASDDEMLAEAQAHGFTNPAEYMAATQDAVRNAVDSVRGPHFAPPARPEPPAPGA